MLPLGRIVNLTVLRRIPCVLNSRAISTSKKKDETSTVVQPTQAEDCAQPTQKKYFYDYGFNAKTEKEEHSRMHTAFFCVFAVMAYGMFYFRYRPDVKYKNWCLREAYLELRRREQLGLPLVDPNYVDPSTILLPSDEELGEYDIIV